MALPNWLQAQQDTHLDSIKNNVKNNDVLSAKLGNHPYKLSLETNIAQTSAGDIRSMQLSLFVHNDNSEYSQNNSVLAVVIPFKTQEELDLARNERDYFVDKLYPYMVEHLSRSASPTILKSTLSSMVDKYIDREPVKINKGIDAVRPKSKATELLLSSQPPVYKNSAATKSNNRSYSNSNSNSNSPTGSPLWKVPPIAMVHFLEQSGVVDVVKRTTNTLVEDNFYITLRGKEDVQPLKISMVKSPTNNKDSLRYVFQHNREGGSGGAQLLKSFVDSYGLFSEYAIGQGYEEKLNAFVSTLSEKPDWSQYNVDLVNSAIQNIKDSAPQRQPIRYNDKRKTFGIAKPLLCDWRGLSPSRVHDLVNRGIVRSGDFHNVKRNNVSSGGFFFYNHFVSPDKPIFGEPDGKVERFQRMMKLKEGGKDKLKKFASGGNRGYFAGQPVQGSKVLWLTEASLDAESMKDLNDLCREYGVPEAEVNCIALLSTSGLKEFLGQRLGVYVKTTADKSGRVTNRQLMKEARHVTKKTIADKDKPGLGTYFSTPIHFVTDGSNEADMALSKLKEFASFTLGREPDISIVNENAQKQFIKNLNEPKDKMGFNKVFDKVSVEDFMHQHGISSVYDRETNSMSWSVETERFERTPLEKLNSNEIAELKQKAKWVMENLIGAESLGSAFDNDKAGQDVSVELKMLCESIDVPFSQFTPQPKKIELRNASIGIKDHNDVLMAVRGLAKENRHEESKALLQSWSQSCKLAPALNPQKPESKHKRSYGK